MGETRGLILTKYSKSNILIGDNVIITRNCSGEKVANPRHAAALDHPAVGDEVFIKPGHSGQKECCLFSPVEVGDKVASHYSQGGGKVAVRLTEKFNQTIQIPVTKYTSISVSAVDPVDLGAFNFKWDGETPVYVRGATGGAGVGFDGCITFDPGNPPMNVVSITATTSQGTLATLVNDRSGILHYGHATDLEITSLLKRGDNSIHVQITSTTTTTYMLDSWMYITTQPANSSPRVD